MQYDVVRVALLLVEAMTMIGVSFSQLSVMTTNPSMRCAQRQSEAMAFDIL